MINKCNGMMTQKFEKVHFICWSLSQMQLPIWIHVKMKLPKCIIQIYKRHGDRASHIIESKIYGSVQSSSWSSPPLKQSRCYPLNRGLTGCQNKYGHDCKGKYFFQDFNPGWPAWVFVLSKFVQLMTVTKLCNINLSFH